MGTRFVDVLELFMNDPETKAIVMVGEIGGEDEQIAAQFIKSNLTNPVVGFIAGKTAPQGKRMGHAGAIISSADTTAESKIRILKEAGVHMVDSPDEIPQIIAQRLK